MNRFISNVYCSRWFPPFILFLFLILTFYRLPWTFFQQDEWRAFGVFAIFEENFREGLKILLPKNFFEHFNTTSFLTEYLQFKFFRMNFFQFAVISLSFHFLNSLLLYRLVLLLCNKKFLSLLVSVIFITSSISHQATTWISTSTSTQGATFFALISLVLFFKYLKNRQTRIRFLFLSLVSFYISLTFKENSVFLFIFFPVFWVIYAQVKNFSEVKKISFVLFFAFLLYLFFRGLFLLNNFEVESAGFIAETGTESVQTSVGTYIYRFAILPFKVLPQSIFTTTFLTSFSDKLIHVAYPHWLIASDGAANPYVLESIGFDYISFVLTVFIFLFVFFIFKLLRAAKNENGVTLLKFSLLFIIISYFPFIFIPGRGGFISIAEPRNLYIPVIGSSIFLALSIMTISGWLSKRVGLKTYQIAVIFLFLLIFIHIKNIWGDLKALQERSNVRLEILKTISVSYPVLPERIVFYTESDTAYYGLSDDDKILPFQSGFGRTLLVWYYSKGEKIPACFFKNDWLYHLDKDEDYKYCEGRGFGYFRSFDTLRGALKENNLSAGDVVAFSWNSKNGKFIETTNEIRKKL